MYLEKIKHFATQETCNVMFTLSENSSDNSNYRKLLHCDHVCDELQFFHFPSFFFVFLFRLVGCFELRSYQCNFNAAI